MDLHDVNFKLHSKTAREVGRGAEADRPRWRSVRAVRGMPQAAVETIQTGHTGGNRVEMGILYLPYPAGSANMRLSAHVEFARFLQIMLQNGGYVLTMIEAYFDESGSHYGAPILCVGGYLFKHDKCLEFDREWRQMLADFRVPFFHMASVETGRAPLDCLPSELRRAMVRRAIDIINETMTYGIVLAVDEQQYYAIIPQLPQVPMIGRAYASLAFQVFSAVSVWADRAEYDGEITYIFESGHTHQQEANQFMNLGARNDDIARGWRYSAHGFRKKHHTPALQAADLLVWHYSDDFARKRKGKKSSDSFVRLINDKYWHFRWTEETLEAQAQEIRNWLERWASGDGRA